MKKLLSLFVLAGVFFFNTGQLYAQDETAADVAQEEVAQESVMTDEAVMEEEPAPRGFTQELKNRFIEGGPGFMGIVLACLIFGLAIAIERIIYLNLATTNTQKLTDDVEAALKSGGTEAAKEVCRNTAGPVASIFYQGLDRAGEGCLLYTSDAADE